MRRRRIRKYARRARAIGRAAAAGWTGTLKGGATGAIVDFLHNEAATRSATVGAHPIVAGTAVLLGGHFAKRRWPTVGSAMCGAGGVLIGQAVRAGGGLTALMPGSGDTQGVIGPKRTAEIAALAGARAAKRELQAAMAENVQAEAAGVTRLPFRS